MYILNPFQHLVAHHKGCLEIVLLAAHVKKVLERFPAEVHHHYVVFSLRAYIVDIGETGIYSGIVLQAAQYFGLIEELWTFCR